MARTALVTGAAAGIGRACAIRLAADGMAVGVLDIDLAGCEKVVAEIEAAGGKAVALQASIADRGQVTAAVATLRDRFGPVTVLVNNAGITGMARFREMTDEQWDRMLGVNLKGTFIVTQTVLPDMEAAKWGRIINISSSSAQTGAVGMAHYSASKGGMIALTRTLAQELGPLGITVNNIPPGTIMNTVMSEAQRDKMPEAVNGLLATLPVGRQGEPEDIAHAASFLASEGASYVTGQTIGVNGGRVAS
jgi:2-hydroxycyclohexanecarboxyl-CoA dehydrogenase